MALAAVAVSVPCAHAAERVTLSNGFDMRCDHHAPVENRTRLYISAGDDNYIDFRAEEIVGVEKLPDPPPATSERAGSTDSMACNPNSRSKCPPEGKLSPVDLGEMLAKAGHEHNLDKDLLASLVKAESGGNANAVSPAGARGLMQLMPSTAKGLGVENSFQPEANVRGGSTYFDALLTRYHDNLALALAAYNAGPQAVDKYRGIPPYRETQTYVARVIHEYNRRVLARRRVANQR